jgi:hypothetical protein
MCVTIGTARNAMEAVFCFIPLKMRFPFSECQNRFFCEAAIESGAQHPHT